MLDCSGVVPWLSVIIKTSRRFRYNDKLSGTPDYLIATRSALGKTVLEAPLVMVAEAKKNDFEQGWGQCLAELVAAQKINGDAGFAVQGIVTDGKLWEFGKLAGNTFVKNIEGFTVDHLGKLFGALNFVFQKAAFVLKSAKTNTSITGMNILASVASSSDLSRSF